MTSWLILDPLHKVFGVCFGASQTETCRYVCLSHYLLSLQSSFKPQITVAICCQGDQTTTADILSFTCSEIILMVHGSLCPQLSFQQNPLWFGFILVRKIKKSDDYWWHQHNPVSAVRAICVLFKIFASTPTLHKNAGLDVLFWMYFFLVSYLGCFFVFCIVISFVICLCKCIRACWWVHILYLCHITTSDWQKPKLLHFNNEKAKEIYKDSVY